METVVFYASSVLFAFSVSYGIREIISRQARYKLISAIDDLIQKDEQRAEHWYVEIGRHSFTCCKAGICSECAVEQALIIKDLIRELSPIAKVCMRTWSWMPSWKKPEGGGYTRTHLDIITTNWSWVKRVNEIAKLNNMKIESFRVPNYEYKITYGSDCVFRN